MSTSEETGNGTNEPNITTLEELHHYLYVAMQLEHSTIPPYLLALYSIHPGTNTDATHIIRTVVVEEMLHLTLAANILNAVGGTPELTKPDFVPLYPTYLPDGENDFMVDLQRFSPDAINTFLNIERPKEAPSEKERLRISLEGKSLLGESLPTVLMHYYSIGEFYREIARGLDYLAEQIGEEKLFTGDPAKQAGPEYYYSGGGELMKVTDLTSAQAAIELICEQGEGLGETIYDEEGELAHFYRFEQLKIGKYYQEGDKPHHPTGPAVNVDWDATYPILKNARIADYSDPEVQKAALAFNESYAQFLFMLTEAYNGQPELLLEAVPYMFRLREKILQLLRNPLSDKPDSNAAPTFEIKAVAKEVMR